MQRETAQGRQETPRDQKVGVEALSAQASSEKQRFHVGGSHGLHQHRM